jgi:hypothetical protein
MRDAVGPPFFRKPLVNDTLGDEIKPYVKQAFREVSLCHRRSFLEIHLMKDAA